MVCHVNQLNDVGHFHEVVQKKDDWVLGLRWDWMVRRKAGGSRRIRVNRGTLALV
jgi:hypothetical protein